MINKNTLCWNVYIEDFNRRKLEIRNIFDLSINFKKGFITTYKKHKTLTDAFFEDIKIELLSAYWCKSEYEIILTTMFSREFKEEKIDVYQQVTLNWDAFKAYLLTNEHLIKQYIKQ